MIQNKIPPAQSICAVKNIFINFKKNGKDVRMCKYADVQILEQAELKDTKNFSVSRYASGKSRKMCRCADVENDGCRTPPPIKSGQRPDRKAGRGVWPAALKLFSVLIFWLLLDQAKSNSPRGN